ncbi:dTMP kinase [Sulfurimonas sp. HSL3-7]|uniref:dTMP kinase n=1 Tax=Sulfonitrofixus jiaomeiensis TaxID=3131938 RepID=UPI0031F7AB7C
MYVAIEGIDTAGKSTQIARLKEACRDAVITKEPGATRIGERIRDIVLNGGVQSAKAEFLLFLADRAEHMQEVIKPNLDKLIISDRSVVSGVAYALVQKSISKEEILALNAFATDGIYPQKLFLLQLSEEALAFRLSQKELDGIEARGTAYLLGIQEALIEAARLLEIELIIINASKPIEAITQEIINTIKETK